MDTLEIDILANNARVDGYTGDWFMKHNGRYYALDDFMSMYKRNSVNIDNSLSREKIATLDLFPPAYNLACRMVSMAYKEVE